MMHTLSCVMMCIPRVALVNPSILQTVVKSSTSVPVLQTGIHTPATHISSVPLEVELPSRSFSLASPLIHISLSTLERE